MNAGYACFASLAQPMVWYGWNSPPFAIRLVSVHIHRHPDKEKSTPMSPAVCYRSRIVMSLVPSQYSVSVVSDFTDEAPHLDAASPTTLTLSIALFLFWYSVWSRLAGTGNLRHRRIRH